jgi:dihydrolipoamide dehydrogenase
MADYDVVVLGAGPGGYVAAIRAAQLGFRVAVIEDKWWGGVCLNVGCIPTKSLIHNAELVDTLNRYSADFGISGDFHYDYSKAYLRSREVAARMAQGVHYLMRKNSITTIDGWGRFTDAKNIEVLTKAGDILNVSFHNCIIATGATTKLLPDTKLTNRVLSYQELIMAEYLPQSIIIAGSGAIGVEFGYILSS